MPKKDIHEEPLREHLTFGFDLGIASCGWAVLDESGETPEIVKAGVWMFDAPETAKERTPMNAVRRGHRGLRRNIKRRAQRMKAIRKLFADHGMLRDADDRALEVRDPEAADGKEVRLDPWRLRAEGLDRMLTGPELAVALGHIAKRRGFKSNSKADRGANAPDEDKKMLAEAAALEEATAKYRTLGEALYKDPELSKKKRNREGSYTRTAMRRDTEHEARELFRAQRRLGNEMASEELEQAFIEGAMFRLPWQPEGKSYPEAPLRGGAFFQRPLQDSVWMVGNCPFLPEEKRAAKRSYSFERFRLVTRMVNLKLVEDGKTTRLSPRQIETAMVDFGGQRKLTYKTLRKKLKLPKTAMFAGVSADKESQDVAARKGESMAGSATLRKALGEDYWARLTGDPAILDQIAFTLTFYEDQKQIEARLETLGLDPAIIGLLMQAVRAGEFGGWGGAGHISAAACLRLIPHLEEGQTYDKACEAEGWNHSALREIRLEDVKSPVARKALSEALKQARAMIREFGRPSKMHIEMARDVGKGIEERRRIERGIERRNADTDRAAEECREITGREPRRGTEELLRYELWKEQGGECVYCGDNIHPNQILGAENSHQVDHILPIGRFGDDSFLNKTLCCSGCNQGKRAMTPHEWMGKQLRWEDYEARVNRNLQMKGFKKRNYLLRDAAEVEEAFRNRNLNDTRWACRAFLAEAARFYREDDGRKRVFARPGAITSRFRRAWGVQSLKKDSDGKRIPDERHHALDAIVCACVSESYLNRVTRQMQEEEEQGGHRAFADLPPPWPEFRLDVLALYDDIFVARAERRRARGKAHDATVRQIGELEGTPVVYERKAVDNLTVKDLGRIKNPERNAALIHELHEWIAAGKPPDNPPLSPKGDPVRKVRVKTDKKPAVSINGGTADRGDMVRVDVFAKPNKRGKDEYYLVPVYPHHVAERDEWPEPPMMAAVSGGKTNELNDDYEFKFSVYPFTMLEVIKGDGEIIEGYFRGLDISTAAIHLSIHNRSDQLRRSIGAKRLQQFCKMSVDRLGNCSEVKRETRTWRGKACTSPNPPGSASSGPSSA